METTNEPQPEKAYAFSLFTKTRPVLIEVAKLLDDPFEYMKEPFHCFADNIGRKLARLPKPDSDWWNFRKRTNELLKKLSDPEVSKDERLSIQAEILKIQEDGARPVNEHNAKIKWLTAGLEDEVKAFEDWSKNDPAGIAAVAQDKAFDEWVKAEQMRRIEEENTARREAKIRQARWKLESQIGQKLINLDIEHPDIDARAARDFLEWHTKGSDWNEDNILLTNAILTGPSGTGKTRALGQAAIRYTKRNGAIDTVEWITGYDFAELVSDLGGDKRQESKDRLAQITFADMLYFDDLGSANFTTARTSRFFRLIDERHKHDLATIFSTNYTTAQLKKLFAATGETKDDATRILRRIIGTPAAPLAKFFHFKRPTTSAEIASD